MQDQKISHFESSSGKKVEEQSESAHLIFSYGTLKKGEDNHNLITDSPEGKATFVGVARTVEKWPLVIASRFNIPFLLYRAGVGNHVIGELYEIDDIMLSHMDVLECHPKYYTRVKAEVEVIKDSNYEQLSVFHIERPWIYFMMNFRPCLLDLPYLEEYASKGPHGLEYVSSETTSDPEDIYS